MGKGGRRGEGDRGKMGILNALCLECDRNWKLLILLVSLASVSPPEAGIFSFTQHFVSSDVESYPHHQRA